MTDVNRQRRTKDLFRRHSGNPILSPADWPYPANAVFNPGAAEVKGETILLARIEDLRGFSHLTVARSNDGKTNWRIDTEPTFSPDPSHREATWGVEDPRIVWLEDRKEYAITYVSFSRAGPLVSLVVTKDFSHFKRLGRMTPPPEDKDACLFPRTFKGRYALIHRPIIRGEAHVWLSFSPDLKHWGDHQILLPVRLGMWDCHRVGLGPQPVETKEGWLIIYHGVRQTVGRSIYRVGLALLDLEEPWKIIKRTQEWVFGPRDNYERMGDAPAVTFPSGAIVEKKTNELRLYYGAADTSVGLATADMGELLDYLKDSPAE